MRNHLKNLWVHLTSLLGTMSARLVVLLVASAIGAALVKCVSPWVLCFFPVSVYGDIRTVIGAAPFTLPVFLALWWFRTYDSFQADWRANFEAGIAHIVSEMPNRIEVGTVMLIKISKATSSYDREIRTAFIRRLKRFPADADTNHKLLAGGYRFAYAQQMLQWLKESPAKKDQDKKYDLGHLDLRNQEFTYAEAQITICEVLEMHAGEHLTVDVTDCNDGVRDFFGNCNDARTKWHRSDEENRIGRIRHKLHKTSGDFKSKPIEITISVEDCRNELPHLPHRRMNRG